MQITELFLSMYLFNSVKFIMLPATFLVFSLQVDSLVRYIETPSNMLRVLPALMHISMLLVGIFSTVQNLLIIQLLPAYD